MMGTILYDNYIDLLHRSLPAACHALYSTSSSIHLEPAYCICTARYAHAFLLALSHTYQLRQYSIQSYTYFNNHKSGINYCHENSHGQRVVTAHGKKISTLG